MKIAIAGFGLEGQANYQYFRDKFPDAEITIFDENNQIDNPPDSAAIVLGEGAFGKIKSFDLVLRTAGLPPQKIGQTDDRKKVSPDGVSRTAIWSSTNEFFAECPAPIIGVTGTKGKGTTSTMIAEILRAHFSNSKINRQVHLVGNIGVPALEVLKNIRKHDVVVYELSSFQLWDLGRSPHIAVITLVEPDHLDVHHDFADYIAAKGRIFAYQNSSDLAIYNQQDLSSKQLVRKSKASKIPFLNNKFVHIEHGSFYYNKTRICPISAVKLPGEHNLKNAAAAISATWDLIGGDTEAIAEGLTRFQGLDHRLKLVREVNGVKFYDDSIATTPGSAIAAVKAFKRPKILIMGGHDKGADYIDLGKEINSNNVKIVYVFGANSQKISAQIAKFSKSEIIKLEAKSMSEIVQTVYKKAEPGDVVILSPAAASFDAFADYKDRGDQFIAAVNKL